jgi:hypothetical protein
LCIKVRTCLEEYVAYVFIYTGQFVLTCNKCNGYVLFIRSTIKVPISISSLVTTALLVRTGSIRKSNETSNVLYEHIPLVDFDITVS